MAEKKDAAAAVALPPPPARSGPPVVLLLVNFLSLAGVTALLFYTRVLYKRPAITEATERQRLAQVHASPTPPPAPGVVVFEPITVNIEPTPAQPKPADGTSQQIHGKMHYVNVGFALEIRDGGQRAMVEELRPVIMDKMLSLLGRRGFHELTTVQGRYILRTQIIELTNQLVAARDGAGEKDQNALVTNVYFTHFVVQ
jgi:flagellar basal body-associated protein FliL